MLAVVLFRYGRWYTRGRVKHLAPFCFYRYILSMHKPIIEKFINQFKVKHAKDNIEVIAILSFGSSFNQKKILPNSDLDVYIVIEDIGKRYRGIMFVGDIEVDYFVYPLKQLQADWERVKSGVFPKRTIAYMLRDSKIILDQNDELKKLRAEAKKFLKNELAKGDMPGPLLIINKYFINDYLKDIEDSLQDKNIFSWQYNVSLLLNDLINVFCQFHNIPLVKPKYQSREIAKKDAKFVELYELITKASTIKERTKRIKKLALYCLKSLGGQLPREWELERPVER